MTLPKNQDPRFRNVKFDSSSIDSYKREYAERLSEAIHSISSEMIQRVCDEVLSAATNGRQIFVIGNGGSAAIAEHLCCDWSKGTTSNGCPVIAARSLTANNSLYSAIANDYGFERVFDTQLELFARRGDVLIAISSSGNSANVLNAVAQAKELGMFVAGFSGFGGGRLAKEADASVHVSIHNYGIVEDAHQAIMHVIAQYIACCRDRVVAD